MLKSGVLAFAEFIRKTFLKMDQALTIQQLSEICKKNGIHPLIVQYDRWDRSIPSDGVILLVRNRPNFGHYVCIFDRDQRLHYFDSYGKPIDWMLEQQDEDLRRGLGNYPHGLELAQENGVSWNEFPFQECSPMSQVCGYWCAYRLKMAKNGVITPDKFARHVYKQCAEQLVWPDLLVFETLQDRGGVSFSGQDFNKLKKGPHHLLPGLVK